MSGTESLPGRQESPRSRSHLWGRGSISFLSRACHSFFPFCLEAQPCSGSLMTLCSGITPGGALGHMGCRRLTWVSRVQGRSPPHCPSPIHSHTAFSQIFCFFSPLETLYSDSLHRGTEGWATRGLVEYPPGSCSALRWPGPGGHVVCGVGNVLSPSLSGSLSVCLCSSACLSVSGLSTAHCPLQACGGHGPVPSSL